MKQKDTKMRNPNLRRMRLISVIWGLLMLILVVGLTIIGMIYKSNVQKYKDVEQALVNAAKKNVEDKSIEIDNSIKFTKEELENEIDEKQKEILKDCEGYAKVEKKKNIYDYKGYIKCDNYKTRNYE